MRQCQWSLGAFSPRPEPRPPWLTDRAVDVPSAVRISDEDLEWLEGVDLADLAEVAIRQDQNPSGALSPRSRVLIAPRR